MTTLGIIGGIAPVSTIDRGRVEPADSALGFEAGDVIGSFRKGTTDRPAQRGDRTR